MDTRAKVQITVDRLETEVSDLRAELADLKELKHEVSQIRAEMVTMPRVEAKLTDMNTEIQKTLQLILQNMSLGSQKTEVVTPSVPPSVCPSSTIPSMPPGLTTGLPTTSLFTWVSLAIVGILRQLLLLCTIPSLHIIQ